VAGNAGSNYIGLLHSGITRQYVTDDGVTGVLYAGTLFITMSPEPVRLYAA